MSADLLVLLDQLDQAHANGTADGLWRFVDHGDRFGADNRFEILDDEGSVAVCSNDNDATETTGFDRVALILAAVNALPKLTAALRAALAECESAERDVSELLGLRMGLRIPSNVGSDNIRAAITDALAPEPVQP